MGLVAQFLIAFRPQKVNIGQSPVHIVCIYRTITLPTRRILVRIHDGFPELVHDGIILSASLMHCTPLIEEGLETLVRGIREELLDSRLIKLVGGVRGQISQCMVLPYRPAHEVLRHLVGRYDVLRTCLVEQQTENRLGIGALLVGQILAQLLRGSAQLITASLSINQFRGVLNRILIVFLCVALQPVKFRHTAFPCVDLCQEGRSSPFRSGLPVGYGRTVQVRQLVPCWKKGKCLPGMVDCRIEHFGLGRQGIRFDFGRVLRDDHFAITLCQQEIRQPEGELRLSHMEVPAVRSQVLRPVDVVKQEIAFKDDVVKVLPRVLARDDCPRIPFTQLPGVQHLISLHAGCRKNIVVADDRIDEVLDGRGRRIQLLFIIERIAVSKPVLRLQVETAGRQQTAAYRE